MKSLTLEQLHTEVRDEIPNDYAMITLSKSLVFSMQTAVSHEDGSEFKLRVDYIETGGLKTWVWAVVVFKDDVHFYKDNVRIAPTAIKHVKFEEPFRTLFGNFNDRRVRRLRSYIYFLFLNKHAVKHFPLLKNISVGRYKAGCMRIAAAKRNKFYGLEAAKRVSEVDDEGYDSEIEELSKKPTKVKRTLSVEEQGDEKRVRRGGDPSQSALEKMQRSHDELRHEHQVLQGDHHNLLEEHRALQANHQLLLESHQALEREVKQHKGTQASIKVLLGSEEGSAKEG